MLPPSRGASTIGMTALRRRPSEPQCAGRLRAEDSRSRRRRVDLALPDWEPGKLRVGVLGDLAALGTEPTVVAAFDGALATLAQELGNCRIVDFGDFPSQRARRAAFFLIETEIVLTHARALADAGHPVSSELTRLLDYARGKSAVDYALADRLIDGAA
jgi:aspartyl-tRNA(Asn)/glutamyl-tRNA(Gln) amidotransferase subunit A